MERETNVFPTKENTGETLKRVDAKKVLLVTTAAGIGASVILELIKTEASAQIIIPHYIYLPLIMK